ncbi:hypothetical protein [Streptomyces herbicida]|uniref:hypothetical protein n=1 Tax=Streptomyces herbicida TaxID=3065675 RepID=UPI00292FB6A4|nr:hypothetical protein [Streptomyces sp. NEAU-HV9]
MESADRAGNLKPPHGKLMKARIAYNAGGPLGTHQVKIHELTDARIRASDRVGDEWPASPTHTGEGRLLPGPGQPAIPPRSVRATAPS